MGLNQELSPKKPYNKHPKFRHVKNKDSLDLLDKMLHFNPEKRINADDALKHPYLKDCYNEKDFLNSSEFKFRFKSKLNLKENPYFIKKMIYDEIMEFNKMKGIAPNGILGKIRVTI